MAVLGGVKYNKDPNNMVKYAIGADHVTMAYGTNFVNSTQSEFWGADAVYNAKTTSAVTADTDVTVLNISGKAGFMTGAMSMSTGLGAGNATNFTWTITVDGVATTILMEAGGRGQGFTPAEVRAVLGPLYNVNYSGQFGYSLMENNPSYSSVGWDNTGPSFRSLDAETRYVANLEFTKMQMPQSCVRFETSLNVKVQMNRAVSTTNYENCGVQYILDRGNY
tara:strand:- start:6651 stop:7316 length:666 start_codon:yes stop_codon:yes gene_type:complete